MKSMLIVVVVVILLAVTTPLNETARRRIIERQSEMSARMLSEAEALQADALALNAVVDAGNLTEQAQRNVRAQTVQTVGFWLALFAALALFFIGVAAFFVNMLLGNEWRGYMVARSQYNMLQADYEKLRAEIQKARQPSQSPPLGPGQAPSAPNTGGDILETKVSSGRRRQ